MKRLCSLLITLSLSGAAFAQDAPPAPEPGRREDPNTTIRRSTEGAPVDRPTRIYRDTRSKLKRFMEGERVQRELDEIELMSPRPLHPEDEVTLRSLRYWIKKRAALKEEIEGEPDKDQKKALEDIEDKIEERYEDLGQDLSIRLRGLDTLTFLRVDYRRNRDFNQAIDDNDAFIPFRTDFGTELRLKSLGRLSAIFTASRTYGANRRKDNFRDRLDLFELYYEPHFLHFKELELTPRVGRQVLRFGNQRILGDDAFSVFHRSFDAARFDVNTRLLEVSAFAGRVVRRDDVTDASFNQSDDDEVLFGAYGALKLGGAIRLELYGLRKDIDRFGVEDSSIDTYGARLLLGKATGLALELEGIAQTGRLNGADHQAYAGAAAVSYTGRFEQLDPEDYEKIDPRVLAQANAMTRYRVRLGIDWASGDDDPFDGDSGTFQPVYPSQHNFQGDADVLGFQNVIDLHASISYAWRGEVEDDEPSSMELRAAYHYFQLDTNRDAAYDFNGLVIAPGVGAGSRELGQELDLRVTFFGTISVGWARFFPGEFLRDSGRDDPVDYFYLAFH